jgi:hypothetical protein
LVGENDEFLPFQIKPDQQPFSLLEIKRINRQRECSCSIISTRSPSTITTQDNTLHTRKLRVTRRHVRIHRIDADANRVGEENGLGKHGLMERHKTE